MAQVLSNSLVPGLGRPALGFVVMPWTEGSGLPSP